MKTHPMPAPLLLPTIARRFNRVRTALTKSPTRFVGVDIGVQTITVASLGADSSERRRNADNGPLTWQSLSKIPLSFDPSSAPSPDWIAETIETLKDHLPRTIDGERSLAVISLPSTWVHYQVVPGRSLPTCQSKADLLFENSVFNSTAHQTHWPVVGMQHGTPNLDDQYVVASTARQTAVNIANAVSDIGFEVQSMLPQGAALLHAAKDLTTLAPQCAVLLNLHGGMVAVNHHSGMARNDSDLTTGCGLCRSLPTPDTDLVLPLSNGEIGLDEIQPWLAEVAHEIDATLNYSLRANMCDESNLPILLCGELACIDGLDSALATLTNRPVACWQYAGQTRPYRPGAEFLSSANASQIANEHCPEDASCALALSLAHQSAMTHWLDSGLSGGIRA